LSIPARVDAFRRLAPPGPKLCKICGAVAPLAGTIDFNKSCVEFQGTFLPRLGIAIDYNRCPACGFLFTAAFDGWSKQDFLETIYNDDYALVDPEYRDFRPGHNANLLLRAFAEHKSELTVLDYGGGNGALAEALKAAGFASAGTYDPFVPEFDRFPQTTFNVVSSYETLEHTSDPLETIGEIASLVAEEGLVMFSTMAPPGDAVHPALDWWYVAPRNGHISIFTAAALAMAWQKFGFTVASAGLGSHIAYRTLPDFARHLLPGN
jgi:SAM-dependent methyltransferase